jgi:hypothetical protein
LPRLIHAGAHSDVAKVYAIANPYRSFRGLLDHLATLTRNDVRFTDTDPTVPILSKPTADQRHAFELIGTTIPPTLK